MLIKHGDLIVANLGDGRAVASVHNLAKQITQVTREQWRERQQWIVWLGPQYREPAGAGAGHGDGRNHQGEQSGRGSHSDQVMPAPATLR